MQTVDISIPILNEEETLVQQIGILVDFLRTAELPQANYQVTIADNGSTDRTAELAEQLVIQYPEVRYIRVSRRGVGLALKEVWADNPADIVGYMDLDFSTDLKHFVPAIQPLLDDQADIVYGSRLASRAQVTGRSWRRTLISKVFNGIMKVYLRTHFSDGMCGFKFLQKKHVRRLMKNGAVSDGWFFSTELLVIGEWLGLRLFELPVNWDDDPNSKVKAIPLALAYLKAMRVLKGKKKGMSNEAS